MNKTNINTLTEKKLLIILIIALSAATSVAQWQPTGGPGPGASVRCLAVNGSNLFAGSYKVEWNAIKYPSGVYFYTLTSEFYNQTKRKALIK